MRFKFCGDLDCPDWVLAEINILAKLTSVKMKLLVNQIIKGLLKEEIDFEKVKKLTSDAKFDIGDIKASVAGIDFIISSATKHDVDSEKLSDELQQLGLPKEHSMALCKAYQTKQESLYQESLLQSFRCSSCLKKVDWKINPTTSDNERTVDIKILLTNNQSNEDETISFTATTSKMKAFLYEMNVIKNQMMNLDM